MLLTLMLLMAGMNSLSHGTQDLYPTFLKTVRHLPPRMVSAIAIVGTLGALCGGPAWGALSERWGRRRALACAALLAIPVIPLWIWSHSLLLLALGGFLMQFMVQGAWGIVPAHLNELSPGPVRAVLPGLAYQLGNLISSRNAVLQMAWAAAAFGGSLAPVLAWTVVIVSVVTATIVALGREARGGRSVVCLDARMQHGCVTWHGRRCWPTKKSAGSGWRWAKLGAHSRMPGDDPHARSSFTTRLSCPFRLRSVGCRDPDAWSIAIAGSGACRRFGTGADRATSSGAQALADAPDGPALRQGDDEHAWPAARL